MNIPMNIPISSKNLCFSKSCDVNIISSQYLLLKALAESSQNINVFLLPKIVMYFGVWSINHIDSNQNTNKAHLKKKLKWVSLDIGHAVTIFVTENH